MAMKTPGSGKTFSEREQELRAAEQNLGALENQQAAEIARLEDMAAKLANQLRTLRASAARPEFAGSRDPQVTGFLEQIGGLNLPRTDGVDEPRERALQARQEALAARSRAAEMLRQAIRGHGEALTRFGQQLSEFDKQLQEHQVRADLERARRERERERELAQQREAQRRTLVEGSLSPARTELEMPMAPAPSAPLPPSPAATRASGSHKEISTRQARVRMQASVDLESESNFFQGFSTNLSEGGLFVATVQMLPMGTQVDLHFTLPGGKKIDAKGVVRWMREVNDRTPDIFPGVGVQFVELPPEAAAAIRNFVTAREPLFFAD